MGVQYRNLFPQPFEGWQWEDADDAAFVEWVGTGSGQYDIGEVAVDRTGSGPPRLRWQEYRWTFGLEEDYRYPVGEPQFIPLVAETMYIKWWNSPSPVTALLDARPDAVASWPSDQYGRPYTLNDLLAES